MAVTTTTSNTTTNKLNHHPKGRAPTPWWRGLLLWLLIVLGESLNGSLREFAIKPLIGDHAARQLAVISGSLLILLLSWLSAPWLHAATRRSQWQIGGLWLGLMLLFELGLGKVLGLSWQQLLADYDLRQGGLMLPGMLVLLLAPQIGARLRQNTKSQAARG